MATKCPSCGSRNRDDEIFCVECGIEMTRFVRSRAPKISCPKCGALNPPSLTNCGECQTRLPPSFVICPDCARENLRSSRWCAFCDVKLEAEGPRELEKAMPPAAPAEHKEALLECPKCGSPMEAGYLIVYSGGRAVRWANEPDNIWGTKGVPVLSGDLWRATISMQGFRCSACRVVTVRY